MAAACARLWRLCFLATAMFLSRVALHFAGVAMAAQNHKRHSSPGFLTMGVLLWLLLQLAAPALALVINTTTKVFHQRPLLLLVLHFSMWLNSNTTGSTRGCSFPSVLMDSIDISLITDVFSNEDAGHTNVLEC